MVPGIVWIKKCKRRCIIFCLSHEGVSNVLLTGYQFKPVPTGLLGVVWEEVKEKDGVYEGQREIGVPSFCLFIHCTVFKNKKNGSK